MSCLPKLRPRAGALAILLSLTAPAPAQNTDHDGYLLPPDPPEHPGTRPMVGPGDPRITVLEYSPTAVYAIKTNYYVATSIHFHHGERLLPRPIIGGDPLAWDLQVLSPNAISVKPILENPGTNMTVQTDRRVYYFHLDVAKTHSITDAIYGVHFTYPLEDSARQALRAGPGPAHRTGPGRPAAARADANEALITRQNALLRDSVALKNINTAYRVKGSANARPETIFDDGRFTYFRFGANRTTPAIYARTENGEQIVNHHNRHNFLIVQRLANTFVLRAGRSKATISRVHKLSAAALAEPRPGAPVRAQGERARTPRTPAHRPVMPNIGGVTLGPRPMPREQTDHYHDMLLSTPAIQALPPTPWADGQQASPDEQTFTRNPAAALARRAPAPATTPAMQEAYIRFTGAAPDIPCPGGEWISTPDPDRPARQQYTLHCPQPNTQDPAHDQ